MGGLTLTLLEDVRRRGVPAVAFVHDDWLDYGRWSTRGCARFTGPRRARLAPLGERVGGLPARVDFGAAARVRLRQRAHAPARGRRRSRAARHRRRALRHRPGLPRPGARAGVGLAAALRRAARPAQGRRTPRSRRSRTCPPRRRSTSIGGWDDAEEQRLRALAARLGVADRVRFARPPRPRRPDRRLRRRGRRALPGHLGGAVGARAARGDGARPARRRHRAAAGRASTCATARTACCSRRATRRRSPPRVTRLADDEALRARLREAASRPRRATPTAVLNAAVEDEVLRAGGATRPAAAAGAVT